MKNGLPDLDFGGGGSPARTGGLPDLDFGDAGESTQAPSRNLLAVANDTAIGTANAAAGLVKAGIDLVAPGSAASNAVSGFIKGGEESQSDWKKAERKQLSSDLKNADGEWDKVKQFGKAVLRDPGQIVEQAVGNVGPFKALGLAFQAAGWGTKASMMAAGGMSAGEVRGNILDKVLSKDDAYLQTENAEYAKLRAGGMSEADSKKEIGTKFVQNLPELMATAVVGSLGGKYGLEGIASGLGKKAKNRVAAAGISLVDEASQGAVEQLATNSAVQRVDSKQALGEDVLLNAAQEGLPGGLGGAVAHRNEQPATTPPGQPANASVVDVLNQTKSAGAANVAATPGASKPFINSAFTEVMGDEGVVSAGKDKRALVALSLSQIEANDGQEALVQSINRLSGGDAAMSESLFGAAQDQDLIAAGKAQYRTNTIGYIEVNDAIRTDAGLSTDDVQSQPEAPPPAQDQTQALPPAAPASSMKSEPQVQAVRSGLLTGAVVSLDEADTLDLSGLQHAIVTAPDGGQFLAMAKDDATVQQFVQHSSQVGVEQAAADMFGPAQGKAVIQQLDQSGGVVDEQVVAPGELPSGGEQKPGGSTSVRTVQSLMDERMAAAPVEQPRERLNSVTNVNGVRTITKTPKFFKRKSEKVAVPEAFTETEQTGAVDKLVSDLNQQLGLQGDQVIDAKSVREVAPSKSLSRMAKAVGSAFGVKLVFVHTPAGMLRSNGDLFNTFSGVADPSSNTVFLNVESNHALNTLGHELAHILEQAHPDIYDKLELVVLSRMRFAAAKQLQASLTAAMRGENGSSAEAIAMKFRQEVVAEGIGEMAEDQNFWKDVFSEIGEDGTQAKTFYSKVMDVIAKLQRALTAAGFITGIRDVAATKKAIVAAYKEWANRYEVQGQNPDNLTPEGKQMLGQFEGYARDDQMAAAKEARAKRVAEKLRDEGAAAQESLQESPLADRVQKLIEGFKGVVGENQANGLAKMIAHDLSTGKLTEESVAFREDWLRKEIAKKATAGKPAEPIKATKVTVESLQGDTGAIDALPAPIQAAALKMANEIAEKMAELGFNPREPKGDAPAAARALQKQFDSIFTAMVGLAGRRYQTEMGTAKEGKLEIEEKHSSELLGIDTRATPGVKTDRKMDAYGGYTDSPADNTETVQATTAKDTIKPSAERDQELIDLRKRESVLKSLLECVSS